MRPLTSRRLLPPLVLAVAAALATTTVTAASAAAKPDQPAGSGLARPASDNPQQRGALAPIGGVVPGLTGAQAATSVGAAADRFREVAADRTRRLTAAGANPALAPAAAAAVLHTDWGVFMPQSRSTGLHATQSVVTGAGTTTHGGDYVYAPTALPAGGACMEMTTAYTPQGPKLWAWDWCGGRDNVGKVVNMDAAFLATYTTTVNGKPAYSEDIHQTNAAANTWTTYLFNYSTHVWDTFYTSSGTYDLPQFSFGWNMFEIYTSIDPATGRGYYCTDLAGRAFESTGMQVLAGGVWTPVTTALTNPIGTIPSGNAFDCPPLTFQVTHPNDAWIAQIGGGTTPPPTGGNLARTAVPSASYTSPWESVAAINDGREPARSNDTANPRWGTWPNQGQQTATLTWTASQQMTSAEVYFFDDGGGVRVPASWRLQYLSGSSFVDVPGVSGYPVALNQYNRVTFPALNTTALRVVLQGNAASVGLLEVRAFGQ
jgi:hypothetical protein